MRHENATVNFLHRGPSRWLTHVGTVGILLCLTNTGCAWWDLRDLFDDEDILLREDVEASDNDGFFPGVRINIDLMGEEGPVRQGLLDLGDPSTVQPAAQVKDGNAPSAARESQQRETTQPGPSPSRVSIDFEYAAGLGGNDAQNLSRATDYVNYGGTVFNAPGTLQSSYDLHLGSVGVRAGQRFFEAVTLEALFGLSVAALDLEIRSASESAQDTGVSLGAHVGARVTVTPHPIFDLYGEGKFHLLGGLQGSRQTVTLGTFEVGGNLHVTSTASLFAGWRYWSYTEDLHNASDLDVELAGPTFGLLLRF